MLYNDSIWYITLQYHFLKNDRRSGLAGAALFVVHEEHEALSAGVHILTWIKAIQADSNSLCNAIKRSGFRRAFVPAVNPRIIVHYLPRGQTFSLDSL